MVAVADRAVGHRMVDCSYGWGARTSEATRASALYGDPSALEWPIAPGRRHQGRARRLDPLSVDRSRAIGRP